MFFSRSKSTIPTPERGPGRPLRAPVPPVRAAPRARRAARDRRGARGHEVAIFGLGCFWGAEELFWQMPGVYSTSVGYAGGFTAHPSYEEVCSRPDRPHRGRARRLRPRRSSRTPTWSRRSSRSTTRPRACARATTSARSTAPAIYATTPEQEQTPRELTEAYGAELARRGLRPDHHRGQARRRRTTTPRTTTSSTSTRTPTATAATAPPESRSRIAPEPSRGGLGGGPTEPSSGFREPRRVTTSSATDRPS